MKLRELTGYKDNPLYKTAQHVFRKPGDGERYSPQEHYRGNQLNTFYNYLSVHGFKRLGQGHYGAVFEKSGYPWVFKIFKEDAAYLKYVKYCKENAGNKHLPKIKGSTIKINDDTYAIRTEKLTRIDPEVAQEIRTLAIYMGNPDMVEFNGLEEKFRDLIIKYAGIYEIFLELRKRRNHLDIHADNVMMRGNDIVLTDPVV